MSQKCYIVAGQKPWAETVYREMISNYPGHWQYVTSIERLQGALIGLKYNNRDLRYIFFLHWSDKVPAEIVKQYECICFHMTELPFGRGGSPLQNLITDGYHVSVLTAFRMTDDIDAGPIYATRPLRLGGLAEEVYLRAMSLSAGMIIDIIGFEPRPKKQQGEPVYYKRRTPEQSAIAEQPTLDRLFDHIRMLDAETYPRAYLDHEGFRYTFSRPALRNGRIEADVDIRRKD